MADEAASIRQFNPPELGTPPGYSQIVEVQSGRLVFIAGQTALDAGGNVVGRGDFAAQADQVFHNVGIALAAVGGTAGAPRQLAAPPAAAGGAPAPARGATPLS